MDNHLRGIHPIGPKKLMKRKIPFVNQNLSKKTFQIFIIIFSIGLLKKTFVFNHTNMIQNLKYKNKYIITKI